MHLWNNNWPGRVVFRALGTTLPQLTDDVLVLTIVVFVVILLKNTKDDFLNILFVSYIKVISWNLKVIIIVFVEVLKNKKDDVLLNSEMFLFFSTNTTYWKCLGSNCCARYSQKNYWKLLILILVLVFIILKIFLKSSTWTFKIGA
jgi:hypothetical protein